MRADVVSAHLNGEEDESNLAELGSSVVSITK